MDNKIDKIRASLIMQYAKLDGKTEEQMKLSLDSFDWTDEFKKIKRLLFQYRIVYSLFMILVTVLIVLAIINSNLKFNALILAGFIGGSIGLQRIISSLSTKIRLLGLLHEIYN